MKLYNINFVCVCTFQLHLYDVDVPGKVTFQESRFLSPGIEFFTFETIVCWLLAAGVHIKRLVVLIRAYPFNTQIGVKLEWVSAMT